MCGIAAPSLSDRIDGYASDSASSVCARGFQRGIDENRTKRAKWRERADASRVWRIAFNRDAFRAGHL
jgi:hypothetical protein